MGLDVTEKLRLPRVSTIIQTTETKADANRLRKWQQQQADRFGIEGAQKNQEETLRMGTLLHSDIERYFQGSEEFEHPHFQYLINYLDKIFCENQKADYSFTFEKRLFSDSLGYCGQFDFLGLVEGKMTIVDWTTSYRSDKRREWVDNKFIQAGAYKLLVEENYEIPVEQLAVFVIHPKGVKTFTYPFRANDDLSINYTKKFRSQFEDPCDVRHYENVFLKRLAKYKKMVKEHRVKVGRQDGCTSV